MLDIRTVGELAAALRTAPRKLYEIADHVDDYVQLYELHDPAHVRRRVRTVMCPTGALRRIQVQLLRGMIRCRVRPSPYSYGGVPGRNALQNASVHLGARYVYTTDIESFFPSISNWQVHDLFNHRLRCSENVSRLLTRLCTYDHHLAQGLVTSPALADQVVGRVDARIGGMCRHIRLKYSRFVDDLAISASFPFDLNRSGIVKMVRQILRDCGFSVAESKEQSGSLTEGEIAITGLVARRGHLDVKREYLNRLHDQIEEHRQLALGQQFRGPLFTREQLHGRIEYVSMVNAHRRRSLRQRFASIDWDGVRAHATDRGLLVARKVLRRITIER
jgi:RNA-directed DNA polymerase